MNHYYRCCNDSCGKPFKVRPHVAKELLYKRDKRPSCPFCGLNDTTPSTKQYYERYYHD